jgi:hypothetical protein
VSDENPYQPIRITVPDGHPVADTAGFTDAIAQLYANLPPAKLVEPIKLTQDQLDAVRAVAVAEPVLFGAPPPLLGTPIIIVENVEDSTPYQRRLEALRRAAEAAMKVPYPQPQLPGPFESLGC